MLLKQGTAPNCLSAVPHVFRFSGGGGGVYCGAKDLHLCEVSGAFNISLEATPQQQQQQQEARLKISFTGASGTAINSDG